MSTFLSNLPTPPKGSSDSSRFTPGTTLAMFVSVLVFTGGLITACMIYKPENASTIITIVSVSAVLMVFHIFGVKEQQQTRDEVRAQAAVVAQAAQATTLTLGEIHNKVNGGTERAMSALREQHRVEMHDKNGELNNLRINLASATMDRDNAIRAQAEAEGRMKICLDKQSELEKKLAGFVNQKDHI